MLVRVAIEDEDPVDLTDHEAVQRLDQQSLRAFKIVIVDFDAELVPVLSSEHLKIMLISSIHDAIALLFAVYHLRTIHVVEHHVLEDWFECFGVNCVEVYEVRACDGDLATRVVNEAADVQFIIL